MSAFKKNSLGQLIKFALVGVSNTLVDLIVTRLLQGGFSLLTTAPLWSYYIPKVIGYACGIVNSYLLNSNWTFRNEKRRDLREIASFLGVNIITLGLSLLLMWLFRDGFGIAAAWNARFQGGWLGRIVTGEFFCTALSSGIALVVNFIGNKFFVFSSRKKEEPDRNEDGQDAV